MQPKAKAQDLLNKIKAAGTLQSWQRRTGRSGSKANGGELECEAQRRYGAELRVLDGSEDWAGIRSGEDPFGYTSSRLRATG